MKKIKSRINLKKLGLVAIPFGIIYILRKDIKDIDIPAIIMLAGLELFNLWIIFQAVFSSFEIILVALLYFLTKGVAFCIES